MSLCRADISAYFYFFFFNDTATTEIYTLSLHDALPICRGIAYWLCRIRARPRNRTAPAPAAASSWCIRSGPGRSEEHTSELQSRPHLVCRLLLEKKKKHGTPLRPRRHCHSTLQSHARRR